MTSSLNLHPITAASFAVIDSEIGVHAWSPAEYAIIRRVIHATADFDFNQLFEFSHGAIAAGIAALKSDIPVITDVQMVTVGIVGRLARIGHQNAYCAIDNAPEVPPPSQTRTEVGMRGLARRYPEGLFVVGNAPTALLALADMIQTGEISPALVIGVPVGFVAVKDAKAAIAATSVPHIIVRGRKGGSSVAAAIVNALVHLAYE
ncbi:MAG: precorrin-8X methylmutase [Cyanobacteria bacterium P01_D01_bin.123]